MEKIKTMKFIDALYNGEVCEAEKALAELCSVEVWEKALAAEKALTDTFSKEQLELYKKSDDANGDMWYQIRKNTYADGMKAGFSLALELLGDDTDK